MKIVIECDRCGLRYTCKRYKENYPTIVGCSEPVIQEEPGVENDKDNN